MIPLIANNLDRAIELLFEEKSLILKAEKLLWNRIINDPMTGEEWEIIRIENNGSLKLLKGSEG